MRHAGWKMFLFHGLLLFSALGFDQNRTGRAFVAAWLKPHITFWHKNRQQAANRALGRKHLLPRPPVVVNREPPRESPTLVP